MIHRRGGSIVTLGNNPMNFPILTAPCALALTAGAASVDYALTILHTHDFHARFEPISAFESGGSAEDNTAGKCFGGTARLVTAIADARVRSNHSILLDGGDQFQGTLLYTYYKGAMAAKIMNKLGYAVDLMVAANKNGVDVIVGGHRNTLLGDMDGAVGYDPTMVGDTAIVQA